jgi:hypothetical protein
MAARSAEQSHTLSLSLMGVAGSLLVGNFATFSTFLALTQADTGVILALIGSSALLLASIVAGGRQLFDLQAKLGLAGVLVSLAPPVLAMTLRETVADTTSQRTEILEAHVAALWRAEADWRAQVRMLETRADELAVSNERLERRVAALEAAVEPAAEGR